MTWESRRGFTLIEVVAAALVFAVGIVMVVSLSDALGEQLERSAVNSLVTASAQTRIDSLTAVPYNLLTVGTTTDTVTFRGQAYQRVATISQYSPLLKQVTVTLLPVDGSGPSRSTTTYVSDRW